MKSAREDLYSVLLAKDSLAPAERLDSLIDTFAPSIDRRALEITLLALEAIDIAVTDLLVRGVLDSSRNFYVYQDQSVKSLIEQVLQTKLDHEQFLKSLILLNETDLIFRFTAARKFRIEDSAAKQLRINSWGKLYIKEKMLVRRHGPLYAQFTEQMKEQISGDKATYQKVVQLLSRPILPRVADRIVGLNAGLTIKLLS